MRFLLMLGLLPFIAACASLTEEQCIAGNWSQIGFNDGVNGRESDYISRHFDACADIGISPDIAAWQAGREQGLPQYCTTDNAYSLGRNGNNFNQVCPVNQRARLNHAHSWGMEYHDIDEEIDRLEDGIKDAQRDIARILSNPSPTPEELSLVRRLRSEISADNRDIDRLRFRLRRYDSSPF